MKRLRLIGVSLLAVLALGAMVASSAEAISPAPSFTIGGVRLAKGKTHGIAAHVVQNFVLTTAELGVKIECSKLTDEQAAIEGSEEGTPGKDHEITHFTGCSLVEGNGAPNCNLENETIITEKLTSEQVENVSGGGGGKQLLEEFFPSSGANFVTLHFTGTSCTLTTSPVSGQVVGEWVLDTSAEGKIELGQTPEEATSWKLRFPATPIKKCG